MATRLLILLFFIGCTQIIFSQTWETNKAKLTPDGCISYEADANNNRIPDFSHSGYKGGGVAIPDIPVKKTINPLPGDNTNHIQNAIDEVSALPLDSTGFRGAVLMGPGTYPVNGQLYIHTSGVVLRGAGDGRDTEEPTVIYGTGNTPEQRDLIIVGGNDNSKWEGRIPNTTQDIVSNFVQVGSNSFEVADAGPYSIGDNIIIYHPCSIPWLEAINYGGTGDDPGWREDQYPIMYNRFITHIEGNEITIDAPVFNHLDRSLSQSYIYTYDREGLITNVGIENLRVDIESLGGDDEDHIWDAINIMQAEDAWVRNTTVSGFALSGIRVGTATRVSIINVHAIDPVAQVTGGRMYNFHISKWSNNILIDNCYARGGRHHYVTNGTGTISGIVVLRSRSENPYAASEGHRQWSTGILFDNLIDYGTYPGSGGVMGFYNRGSGGTAHGWGAAHSVMWNCSAARPGTDAGILVEQPPTAQNYAIGCKGKVGIQGNFNQPTGYIEGSNLTGELVPASLYEAQLLCRKDAVISDFSVSKNQVAPEEPVIFTSNAQGAISEFLWDFGLDAMPSTANGEGPHKVLYNTTGVKSVTLRVSNGTSTHTETKTAYVLVDEHELFANNDEQIFLENDSVTTSILDNDYYPLPKENKVLVLDGVDDKVTYDATRLVDTYPLTMMAWINTTSAAEQVVMYLGKPSSNFTGNSFSMQNGAITLQAWSYDGSSIKEDIADSTVINDGNWHHIAGVFASSTDRRLYIDGRLVGTDDAEMNNLEENLYRFSVGNRDDRIPNGWFEGKIDEVRLYTSALTQEAINEIMTGWDCSENEKLLHWNFDQLEDSIVLDQFNYFDGRVFDGIAGTSDLTLRPLQAFIIQEPTNGSAYFTDDFEIIYIPAPGFFGNDSLTYELQMGDCLTSSAKIYYQVDEVVGVKVINDTPLLLYPNPTTGPVQLQIEQPIKRIELYKNDGTFVDRLPSQKEINVEGYPKGIYLLKVILGDGQVLLRKVVRM